MRKRKYYALWHGGSSYACPGPDDIEEFSTLQDIKEVLWARHKNQDYPYTPCVDQDTEFQVFINEPPNFSNSYPDYIIDLGPRGGIRCQKV